MLKKEGYLSIINIRVLLGKKGDDGMNRIVKYIFLVLSLMVVFTFSCTTNVHADEEEINLKTMEEKANKFIEAGSQNVGDIDYSGITKQFSGLGQILTAIGAGVMVIVVTYMGIKYLTAGPEAQAKLKIQLIGVVVSGVVIFGSYTIWSIVVKVAENF